MRVKIAFPDTEPLCRLRIPVRIGDINYGGHVGNDAILSIMQESRMQWLAQARLSELNLVGHGMIMSDAMVAFRAESFYGDVLDVIMYAEIQSPRSFDLLYRITVQRDEEIRIIAEAKSGMVCFDYESRKVVSMGNALKTLLGL